jgi:hypothetical protein
MSDIFHYEHYIGEIFNSLMNKNEIVLRINKIEGLKYVLILSLNTEKLCLLSIIDKTY